MPFALFRASEQYKLRGMALCQALDQLEVTFFPPLLELPPVSGAGVEADHRTREIDAQPLQMHAATRTLLFVQFEHVTVRRPGSANNIQHEMLVGFCALALEIVEDAHFEPFSCGSICRLHVTSRIKKESILLGSFGHAGQCGAGLACIQVDHAVKHPCLQLE